MNINTLICPKCGGSLEVEDGLDTFFCKYCGNKIILSDLSDAAYEAKITAMKLEHEKYMKEEDHKEEQAKWERTEKTKERENKEAKRVTFIVLGIFAAVFLIGFSPFVISCSSHTFHVAELKKYTKEIEEDIEAKDYDHALLIANKMRIEDGWDYGETREWNNRRKEYIRIINEAKGKDTKLIYPPFDSEESTEYVKKEAIEVLEKAGFKNIIEEGKAGSAGIFKPKNKVISISIDGESSFTKADTFFEDDEVIIQYYQK